MFLYARKVSGIGIGRPELPIKMGELAVRRRTARPEHTVGWSWLAPGSAPLPQGVAVRRGTYMSMLACMSNRMRTTVTLPADLVAHARDASDGNLSAYIERALRAQQLRDAAPAVRAWRERAQDDTEELADTFGEEIA